MYSMGKKCFYGIFLGCWLYTLTQTLAQGGAEGGELPPTSYDNSGIDAKINSVMEPIGEFLGRIVFCFFTVNGVEIPFILLWLLVGCLFCTIYFWFINIRAFGHALDIAAEKYHDPDAIGHITHFQALTTAISGTVGLGNIAGVAIAISLGGPGATFWMILCGFCGMSVKFAEATLGVKYREVHKDGSISGGPMQYITKGLHEEGCGKWCSWLGVFMSHFYCVVCIGGAIGGACLFQSNQTFLQLVVVCGSDSWIADKGWLFGIFFAVLCGLVIMGGVSGIVQVTSRVVPFMGGLYILSGIIVLLMNAKDVPDAVRQIFEGAFNPTGITGGVVGVMLQGIRRSIFSNEAGLGSSGVAHAPVKTSIPVTEGLVALYEPFIDTVCVCTVTAVVIVITGYWDHDIDNTTGVQLTSDAFSSTIPWFPYVLTVAVALFAYSTIITWSYYGVKCTTYLFGYGKVQEYTFKIIYLLFVIVGASIDLGAVIDIMDSLMFLMAIPNLIALYITAKSIKCDLDAYWADYKGGKLKKKHHYVKHDTSTEHSDSKELHLTSSSKEDEIYSEHYRAPLSEI